MAHMTQEHKSRIVKAVKEVLPKGWKVTFAVRHHSTIVCTVRSAPLALSEFSHTRDTYADINVYNIDRCSTNQNLCLTLQRIVDALNLDNYNNSDVQTDYFDVGHYVDLRFGSWDKPFIDTRVKN